VRPLFPQAQGSSRLWLGKSGPLGDVVGSRITKLTRRLFGIPINPHLLRDCAASSLAAISADMARAAAPLLGHGTFLHHRALLHPGRQPCASRRLGSILTNSKPLGGPCMKRAAIYARYSSENQRDASIEDQIEVCRRYAATAASGHGDLPRPGALRCQQQPARLQGTCWPRPAEEPSTW
jgi:hypothetical protein